MRSKLYTSLLVAFFLFAAAIPNARAQNDIVLTVIQEQPEFSDFAAAISIAGLENFFKSAGPYTVFVPNDNAFGAIDQETWRLLQLNPSQMRQLVLNHVIPGKLAGADLAGLQGKKSSNGSPILFNETGDGIMSGAGAAIIQLDITAGNGVIHEIDAVLIPGGLQLRPPPQPTSSEEEATAQPEPGETSPPPASSTPSSPMGIGPPPNPTFVLLTVPVLNPAFQGSRPLPYRTGVQVGSSLCKGMSWVTHKNIDGVALVGADSKSNPYRGDTYCTEELPVLCFLRDNSEHPPPEPPYLRYDRQWSGGRVKLTAPIAGSRLTSPGVANNLCAATFGAGWRMAEFHDGYSGNGGWKFWAYGGMALSTRFWVAIDDQFANPWNSIVPRQTTPPAASTVDVPSPYQNPAYQGPGYIPRFTGEAVSQTACRGMSWTLLKQNGNVTLVGADSRSNPYRGDTDCSQSLPVLCIKVDGFSPPPNVSGDQFNINWSGGQVQATFPVNGNALRSRTSATNVCVRSFGNGWRIASMHDGVLGTDTTAAWRFWAYGSLKIGERYWVAVYDQPANPWSP